MFTCNTYISFSFLNYLSITSDCLNLNKPNILIVLIMIQLNFSIISIVICNVLKKNNLPLKGLCVLYAPLNCDIQRRKTLELKFARFFGVSPVTDVSVGSFCSSISDILFFFVLFLSFSLKETDVSDMKLNDRN